LRNPHLGYTRYQIITPSRIRLWRMRGAAFWYYQNIAGYTFRDHPNEYARPLLRARRCARQDVLMSTKMPAQERLSPIREALPLTRTRRPVKRLKIRKAVLPPPNILKKPFPPEGDGRGRNYVYTRSHRITQFYTAVHNYCRNSLLFPQPNTVFLLPLLYEGNSISLIAGCTFVCTKVSWPAAPHLFNAQLVSS
jgi:hypothetical protein